jgi:hypothetical protein
VNSEAEALMSLPLFAEYETMLGRPETQRRCPLTAMEQTQLLDALLSRTRLGVGHRSARAAQPGLSVVGVGQWSTLIGTYVKVIQQDNLRAPHFTQCFPCQPLLRLRSATPALPVR